MRWLVSQNTQSPAKIVFLRAIVIRTHTHKTHSHIFQQQQLKKLGIIIHYLDHFNRNRSLHTPRAQGQTASQSEPLERATLLPGLSPGYVWLCSHTTVVSKYALSRYCSGLLRLAEFLFPLVCLLLTSSNYCSTALRHCLKDGTVAQRVQFYTITRACVINFWRRFTHLPLQAIAHQRT